MKTMYACEKCGMVHENWKDANQCEESHLKNFEVIESLGEFEYASGSILPKKIIVASKSYNYEQGSYDYKYFAVTKITEISADSAEGKQLRFLQDWADADSENYSFNYRKEREAKKASEEANQ